MENGDRAYIGVDNIIINDEGEILLARRSENAKTFPGMWNLVSGDVEAGESIEDALKREAKEEAGVDIEIVRFTGRYYDRPGGIRPKPLSASLISAKYPAESRT